MSKLTHNKISFIKSGLRIIGFLALAGLTSATAITGVVILVLAEILGIIEEIV